MIYRVHLYDSADGSDGYVYGTSRRQIAQVLRAYIAEDPNTRTTHDIESAPTPKTKAGIVALLKAWGSHPNNG